MFEKVHDYESAFTFLLIAITSSDIHNANVMFPVNL